MPVPQKFNNSILETSFSSSDIDLLRSWGIYLAKDDVSETRGARPGDRPKKVFEAKNVTTSQLRKFFGEIKRIQADFDHSKQSILLLDPKIAYAVGRAKKDRGKFNKTKLEDLYSLLSPLLKSIDEDKSKFKNFVSLCEAIVAYHKAAGGE